MISVRHWLAACCLPLTAAAEGVTADGSLTAAWNDNLSHSAEAADRREATVFSADGSFSRRFPLSRDTALLAGGAARVETCPSYDGIDTLAAVARLAVREKFGLGALAPVLSLNRGRDLPGIRPERLDRECHARPGQALQRCLARRAECRVVAPGRPANRV
jgi:hypothetical protein